MKLLSIFVLLLSLSQTVYSQDDDYTDTSDSVEVESDVQVDDVPDTVESSEVEE